MFLDKFELADEDWKEVLFKVWVARVLNYTMRHVLRGYHCALQANTDMMMKLHMKRSMELFEVDHMAELALEPVAKKGADGLSPASPPSR